MQAHAQMARSARLAHCARRNSTRVSVPPCRSTQPEVSMTGVFQLQQRPAIPHHSMADVRDAVETCQCVGDASQRCQCYEVFGLDGRKVEAYYLPVTAMETTLTAVTTDDDTGRTVAGLGSFMFSMILLSKIVV